LGKTRHEEEEIMLIVMEKAATPDQIQRVVETIEYHGWSARPIPGGDRVSIGILKNEGPVDPALFLGLAGVKDAIAVTRPYKLVSRETKPEDTLIEVNNVTIGNGHLTIIAGPCAIESETQAMTIAEKVKETGAHIFRGGAYKPRTSPYTFQGLGLEGLKIMAKVRETFGMPIITEAMDIETYDEVEAYADIIQIGTRNMQNFSLLKKAGKSRQPVMLKRGLSATLDEWLMAAEYIMAGGNPNVILCERGVRTFVKHSRNTLDLSVVPVVLKESHLPIIIDPSHAAGKRDQVIPLSRAAVAVGAHGLMVEVHNEPDKALSDGAQSLYPEQFNTLLSHVRKVHTLMKNN
jgi:3-deoxy-7-phosphoheptulonate synthase